MSTETEGLIIHISLKEAMRQTGCETRKDFDNFKATAKTLYDVAIRGRRGYVNQADLQLALAKAEAAEKAQPSKRVAKGRVKMAHKQSQQGSGA